MDPAQRGSIVRLGLLRIGTIGVFLFAIGTARLRAQEDTLLLQGKLTVQTYEDTARANLLIELAQAYAQVSSKQFFRYATEAQHLCEKLKYHQGSALIGLELARYFNMHVHDAYQTAEMRMKALHEAELAEDTSLIITLATDLGGSYAILGRYELSESYLERAVALSRQQVDTGALSMALYDFGLLRSEQKRFEECRALSREGARLDGGWKGQHLMQIGASYSAQGRFDSSAYYLRLAVPVFERQNNHRFLSYTLGALAQTLGDQGRMREAVPLAERALRIALDHHLAKETTDAYSALEALAKLRKDAQAAYRYHALFETYQDSMMNLESAEKAGRTEAQYEAYQREEAARVGREREQALADVKEKRRKLLLLVIASLALGVSITSFVIYRAWRSTRKKNLIIQEQKRSVEEKQRALIDSINYSRGLQEAILPPEAMLREHFLDHFVLYVPKDIVSGDFYWMDVRDGIVFFAVADATGHGVPGALVSVVCANALAQAVRDHGLRTPGEILDKATELVLDVLRRHTGEVKDGMDISLLSWHKSSGRLQWSGANLPLWMVPEPEDGKRPTHLKKIRPDRQPVGAYPARTPFRTHTFTAPPGTTFYLFTDGCSDQFGGPKDKKFMLPRFEATILSTYDRGSSTQARAIERVFAEWRGTNEQTDDMTVVGLRI